MHQSEEIKTRSMNHIPFSFITCCLLTLCGLLRPCAAESRKNEPPATTWKLFVDDYWIESKSDVRRVLHQPQKHPQNPLIQGVDPWAINPYCYGTVIFDKTVSRFKLWYMSYNQELPVAERTPILYATSIDGITWDRPSLGLVSFRGSNRNNILMNNYGYHALYSPSVLKDDRDPDPQRRYKMIWWDFPKGNQGYRDDGMCVAFSADGIRWSKQAGNPVLYAKKQERSISDVMSVMFDSRTNKYVAYTKGWADPWPAFRQIVRTESSDFIHWSEPKVVLRHSFDENDPQSYGMSVTQYESLYLGLLCSYKLPGNQTIDVQLSVSHDNRNWKRVADQATFLPIGPPGRWDDGMIFCTQLITHKNRILIYYGGWDAPHNVSKRRSGIGLATLRKDGFVSLNAGPDEGHITTKVLRNVSGPLLINANAQNGLIRVEVLGDDNQPLPGFSAGDCLPVMSDGTEQRVRWNSKNKLPHSANGLRLRFSLRDAALYSFLCGK